MSLVKLSIELKKKQSDEPFSVFFEIVAKHNSRQL